MPVMTGELERYHGREQSYIKHSFLTEYLKVAGYKTLQGRSPTFNFVDAFAGPWNVTDEDNYSDASFDQALRTLESVRASLGRSGVAGLKVRFCLCEKRGDAVAELRRYVNQKKSFEIHIFQGSFEDRLDDISAVCRDGFTFTFIDPTGWDIRSAPVMDFLGRQNGEFLLNFMAEPVDRHAGYSGVSASFGRFLADPDWERDFDALPSEWGNERRVMCILKKRIKTTGAATYLPDFPILNPRKSRIKMRLLLGTNSRKGLEVFRDVQSKVERNQIEMRNQLRDPSGKHLSLFSDEEIAALQQQVAGVGCPNFQHDAEARVKEFLSDRRLASFEDVSTDALEHVPIRLTQLKKLFNAMRERGVVNFDLAPGKRVPQSSTHIRLTVPDIPVM